MAENTQTADLHASGSPEAVGTATIPAGYGWCSWHENYVRNVRLINTIEQGSGPGASQYACLPCRQAYDLTLFADHPL